MTSITQKWACYRVMEAGLEEEEKEEIDIGVKVESCDGEGFELKVGD